MSVSSGCGLGIEEALRRSLEPFGCMQRVCTPVYTTSAYKSIHAVQRLTLAIAAIFEESGIGYGLQPPHAPLAGRWRRGSSGMARGSGRPLPTGARSAEADLVLGSCSPPALGQSSFAFTATSTSALLRREVPTAPWAKAKSLGSSSSDDKGHTRRVPGCRGAESMPWSSVAT